MKVMKINVKYVFYLLLITTYLDLLLTYIGVTYGFISEYNPVMVSIINSFPLFLILVSLLGVGFLFIYYVMNSYSWVKYAMVGVLVPKIIIIVMHGYGLLGLMGVL